MAEFNPVGRLLMVMALDDRNVATRLEGIELKATAIGAAFTAMGSAILGSMGQALELSTEFDQAITNTTVVTGNAGDTFDDVKGRLGDLARTLGETTVFTANEAALAMEDLARKGFDVSKFSLEELEPLLNLAAATQTNLTTATSLATSSIRSFGLETEDLGSVVDTLTNTTISSAATIDKLAISLQFVAPLASAAGISFEEMNAALGVLFNAGLSASVASTALRRVITELIKPSNNLDTVLNDLGLTYEDISFETNTLADILDKLRLNGLSAEHAMKLFGQRGGPTAIALTGVNDAGIPLTQTMRELTKANQEAGGVAEKVAELQFSTLKGQTIELQSKLQSLGIEMFEGLLPSMAAVVHIIGEFVAGIVDILDAIPLVTPLITLFVTGLGSFLTVMGLAKLSTLAFNTAFGAIPPTLTTVQTVMGRFGAFLGKAGLWGIAIALGIQLMYSFWKSLSDPEGWFQKFVNFVEGVPTNIDEMNKEVEAKLGTLEEIVKTHNAALEQEREAAEAGDLESLIDALESKKENLGKLTEFQEQEARKQIAINENQIKIYQGIDEGAYAAKIKALQDHNNKLIGQIHKHHNDLKESEEEISDEIIRIKQEHINAKLAEDVRFWEWLKELRRKKHEEMIAEENARENQELADKRLMNWIKEKMLEGHFENTVLVYKGHVVDISNLTAQQHYEIAKGVNAESVLLDQLLNKHVDHTNKVTEQYNIRIQEKITYRVRLAQVQNYIRQQWLTHYDLIRIYMANFNRDLRAAQEEQEEILEEGFGGTQTIHDNTRKLWALLEAAAQNTFIDEMNGKIFSPFVFEQEELLKLWGDLTKKEQQRIKALYAELAGGVGGDINNLNDIVDRLFGGGDDAASKSEDMAGRTEKSMSKAAEASRKASGDIGESMQFVGESAAVGSALLGHSLGMMDSYAKRFGQVAGQANREVASGDFAIGFSNIVRNIIANASSTVASAFGGSAGGLFGAAGVGPNYSFAGAGIGANSQQTLDLNNVLGSTLSGIELDSNRIQEAINGFSSQLSGAQAPLVGGSINISAPAGASAEAFAKELEAALRRIEETRRINRSRVGY